MENGTAVASLNGGGAATQQLMMDTSTTADEEMNGLDLSTKSNNSMTGAAAGPISLTISSSNGSTEGTPTPGTPLNGSPEKGLEAGQISPSSLRRSTRASAIKAQQKIKDGDVPQSMEQENCVESEDESVAEEKKEPLDGESAAKKRKLENGKALDQFSHEFSIKMEDDGGVYMLDEGSELSSLNETEIETLKKCYDKLLARELTSEQKEERTRMIKQAEADLRNEEAKLTMLKKMRSSQIPKHNPVSDLQRKLAANVAANSAGAAYKPPVAGAAPAAKNNALAGNMAAITQLLTGKGSAQAQQQLLQLLQNAQSSMMPNMTPQQKEALARMGQLGTAQLMAAVALQQRSGQQLTKEQQQQFAAALLQQSTKQQAAAAAATSTSSNSNTASSAASAAIAAATTAASSSGTSTPSASSSNPAASSALTAAAAASSGATTAQKLAAARHAFRKTADGQLITQTVMPKACPNELFFIPNPNAPDFLYMLGLDQVVGRVLKDKNATKPTNERPYECEECGSDFATGWKCIGTKEDDLHLYCEGCLRQAQKKKLRHDRNSQLKKIYSKVALQEKEFEKQISDGKLDGMLATVFAQLQGQNAAAAAAARPTAAASPAVQNLSTKPATTSVPSPAAMQKPATPLSTPSGSKTASSMNSSSTSSGTKRPATANSQQQLQTQLAQLAQLARTNPMMMSAMMGGGMMGGQAQAQAAAAAAAMSQYAPMLQQMQQMQQLAQARMQQANNNSTSNAAKAAAATTSSAAASNNSSNNATAAAQNMAMTMLAQAMQNAQNRNAAGNSSNNAANASSLMMAQLAALTQAQNQFGNPQLLRQMQQLAAAQMQKNASKK